MTDAAAPCGWEPDTSCDSKWDDRSETARDRGTMVATEVLYALSGRRFGVCSVTVRPCLGSPCADPCGYPPGVAYALGIGCGCGASRCGHARYEIALPGPVHEVTTVTVDGAVLVASAYRVDRRRWLVRQDGDNWPTGQDLSKPAGEPNTWSVVYEQGTPVPPSGNYAAGVLASEIAKACAGDAKCRLPQRVQSISRQGVELALLDPMDFLDEGRTGIPEVDQWLAAVNPKRLPAAGRVWSPDLPRFR